MGGDRVFIPGALNNGWVGIVSSFPELWWVCGVGVCVCVWGGGGDRVFIPGALTGGW